MQIMFLENTNLRRATTRKLVAINFKTFFMTGVWTELIFRQSQTYHELHTILQISQNMQGSQPYAL